MFKNLSVFIILMVIISCIFSTALAQDDVIKIGLAGPLTGSMAQYGELMRLGAQIAADEINAAGGVDGKKIEIVMLDDKQDPKEAALVAQRFVDDDSIFAVISHGGSSMTLAAAPIYEAAGMSNIAPSSSNGTITELGYNYFVRYVLRDDRQSPQVIALMANNLGLKKIAVIFANTDYGRGNLDYATEAAGQLGVEIVAAETYNPGDKDFSTLLTKIKRSGAEGIAIYADYNEGGLIMGQAWKLGMENVTWVGQSALTYQKLVELATPEALQNLYILVTYNPYDTRETVVKFLEKFHETQDINTIPSEVCAFCYDVVHVISQAIESGASKDNLALFIKNSVPGQEEFHAKNLNMDDDIVWDNFGDITPRGVQVLRVSPEGRFVSTDINVDITGLTMIGVVK